MPLALETDTFIAGDRHIYCWRQKCSVQGMYMFSAGDKRIQHIRSLYRAVVAEAGVLYIDGPIS